MARPALTSRQAFIDAALEFIDRHGVDELSLRTLGKEMEISHATLYRHFANKDELINALIDDQLGAAIKDADLSAEPLVNLRNLAHQLRRHFDAHPNLLRPWINGTGEGENAFQITRVTLDALAALGISRPRLGHWLRVLENFVIGSMVYDYAAAPNHLSIRARRLNFLAQAGYLEGTFEPELVSDQNRLAFESALEILLQSASAEGKRDGGY